MAEKFDFYQRYGVEEYYIYDPEDGPLEGWRRAGDHLEQIPQMPGFVSPRLLIRFEPGPGPDNLTILGPDGTPFLSFREWVEKAKADQRRAESAELLALEQTRLVSAERQRAERLAAQLRELGIEPE